MDPLLELSSDPRTSALLAASGCSDADSEWVLGALGRKAQVLALARGLRREVPVALVVDGKSVHIVSLGTLGMANVSMRRGRDLPARLATAEHRGGLEGVVLTLAGRTYRVNDIPARAARSVVAAVASDTGESSRPSKGAQQRPPSKTLAHVPAAARGQAPPVSPARSEPICPPGVRSRPVLPPSARLAPDSWYQKPRTERRSAVEQPEATVDTWEDAEHLAAEHLRLVGYADAHVTPPGADSGIDVRGRGVVAQVKFWARPVGAPPLRDLLGVATSTRATPVFYSFAGYTTAAISWGTENGIALLSFECDGTISAENTPGHELMSRWGDDDSSGRDIGSLGQRLWKFDVLRIERCAQEGASLRATYTKVAARVLTRSQSTLEGRRGRAAQAAAHLTRARRLFATLDRLAPEDRRRQDTHRAIRTELDRAKRLV